MSSITVRLEGIDQLQAQLEQAAAKLAKPQALMQGIAGQLEMNVNYRFDNEEDPTGKQWVPLSPMTAKFYTITGGGKRKPTKEDWAALRKGEVESADMPGKLLQRTGHFRTTLRSDGTDNTAEVGFTRTVGVWPLVTLFEFGTKSMPRRGLLTADPETSTLGDGDIEDIGSLVNLFLDDLL
jgi:phage gpG-like protein